jgi:hypothetical protein
MIKLEHTEVVGWEHAIRGMRNPMNSWDKSDSCSAYDNCISCGVRELCDASPTDRFFIGPNDHELMMKLRNAGTDHRKFMRMIVVYLDITAPLYWWKEYDTYKVGTVANSCSTMHKIHAKEFTLDDFSHEKLAWDKDDVISEAGLSENVGHITHYHYPNALLHTINALNSARAHFLQVVSMIKNGALPEESLLPRKKFYWNQMIQLLPTSYNQKRTVMLNYEVLANIYRSRKNHKLQEWRDLCKWIESLPYSEIITGVEVNDKKEEKKDGE